MSVENLHHAIAIESFGGLGNKRNKVSLQIIIIPRYILSTFIFSIVPSNFFSTARLVYSCTAMMNSIRIYKNIVFLAMRLLFVETSDIDLQSELR